MREPTTGAPGAPDREPAEGPEMNLPGADEADPSGQPWPGDAPDPGRGPRPDPDQPDTPDADVPQRLGERIENGPGPGIAAGEPDLMPNVDVPEETM